MIVMQTGCRHVVEPVACGAVENARAPPRTQPVPIALPYLISSTLWRWKTSPRFPSEESRARTELDELVKYLREGRHNRI